MSSYHLLTILGNDGRRLEASSRPTLTGVAGFWRRRGYDPVYQAADGARFKDMDEALDHAWALRRNDQAKTRHE